MSILDDPSLAEFLVNDYCTRSFLAIPVGMNNKSNFQRNKIVDLIKTVDQSMLEYNKPTFYDPPVLHLSIASLPGDLSFVWNLGIQYYKEKDQKEERLVNAREIGNLKEKRKSPSQSSL